MGSDVQWRTRERARWDTFCFTTTLGRTLLFRLKTSSPHLSGNKLTTTRFGAKWFSPLFTPKEGPGQQAIWRRRWPEMCSEEAANVACHATIRASLMAASMWKNILKNVEFDNNKILYETLLDLFYSETVFTFWISLVTRDRKPTWLIFGAITPDFY